MLFILQQPLVSPYTLQSEKVKLMKHSEETKRKISETLKRKGIKPTVLPSKEQCLKNLGDKLMKDGDTPWNKDTQGLQTAWNKGKKFPQVRGENNGNWKGGVLQGNRKVRRSSEYRNWRKSVFERDDYTCQECGVRGGVVLNADHIKPFALYPELRFDMDNGRTLCTPCHKKTDTYGSKLHNYAAAKGLTVYIGIRE